MKTPLIIMAVAMLFAGCADPAPPEAALPSGAPYSPVKTSYSGFDNAKVVTVEPISNTQNSTVKLNTVLGAQWNAAHPEDVILIAGVFSLKDRQGIAEAELIGITGAELNIDGEKTDLQPTGTIPVITDNFILMEYTNGYTTKLSVIDKILKSKRTWLRVHTPTGTVENAVIDGGLESGAYQALEKFMVTVNAP